MGWMLLLSLCALAARAQPLDPGVPLRQLLLDAWTPAEGLPQMSVNAALQTRDGYLWVGTQEGLARFDGHTFERFDKWNSGLPGNYVNALYEDADGMLWVGTYGAGLACLRDGRIEPVGVDVLGRVVSDIEEDASGALWVSTLDAGVFRLREDGFERPAPAPGGDGSIFEQPASALAAGPSGVWVGLRASGLLHVHARGADHLTTANGLPGDDVMALHVGGDGLWVGTQEHGLARYHDGRFEAFGADEGFEGAGGRAFHAGTDGSLWVGTEYDGLFRHHRGRFERLTDADGLPHNSVFALEVDHEGGLWVGLSGGGLVHLRRSKFTTLTEADGLAYDHAFAVLETADGALWVGTEGGGLSRYHAGQFETFTAADGLGGDVVISLAETPDGALWAGTYGGGLSRYHAGRFETFTAADGLPGMEVFALFTDRSGTLWVGTADGLARYTGGRGTDAFEALTTADGLSSNLITALAEDAAGRLWVGTYDEGLNVLGGGAVAEQYGVADGLLSAVVLAFHVDGEDVWVGTQEGGLHRIRDGRLVAISKRQGLPFDSIYRILEDADGHLWVTGSGALARIDKADVDALEAGRLAALAPTVLGSADGLGDREFYGGVQPAGWEATDGRLWFPTNRGIVGVDPAALPTNTEPPPVHVRTLVADGEARPAEAGLELPPGGRRFEFHYSGLSYAAPEAVRFRYRLDGEDHAWVAATDRRTATYTNLAPGTYTFRVQAANNDGVWSEEGAAFTFTLRPFFYQTAWFAALCVVLALGLAFGAYALRVRHLKAQRRALEREVKARTHDLRMEKEKTERAKELIEQQADQLREMDRVKTKFFHNISHEFRTPLTLNIGPLENALAGVYGPLEDALRPQLEVMLRNARHLLRLINQLLDLARLESGRAGLKLHHGDFGEHLEGVVYSFSAFAAQKQIDLLYHPPDEPVHMFFDRDSIEKVVFNLLSNAIKFTPEGGRITVDVALGDGPRTVRVRVADSGVGIPAADLPLVFDRFHQVEGTVSQVQAGTGIGLSLVKELVELHGGTIDVESAPGAGTTFSVVLPTDAELLEHVEIAEEADEAPVSRGALVEATVLDGPEFDAAASGDGQAAPAVGSDGALGEPPEPDGRPLVLVVDDNPDIRQYVAACLERGYRVIAAADGAEGVERARQQRPELVLSDVRMPKLDGYGLCRQLKGDPSLQHIPIVLLTSRSSLDDRIEGLEAGADDFLTKPFNARELLARIGNLITLRVHQRQVQALNDELRETNTALKEANDALSEASALKTHLMHVVAHDLKNPLNGVREFAKLLQDDEDAPPDLLEVIETSADQMLTMVTQLLDAEALESGRIAFEMGPVRLRPLLKAATRTLAPQAERKGQRIHLELGDPPGPVASGDFDRLREAADNLLSNAVKYAPPGTSIWVRTGEADGRPWFEVEDQGPGFTDEDRARMFGKFQKLSAQPTGGESSSGLGLSIVRHIIDVHGGEIDLETAPGDGARFRVWLPAAEG